jgi:hypothetical protein
MASVPVSPTHRPATRPSAGVCEPAGPLPPLHVLRFMVEAPETAHTAVGAPALVAGTLALGCQRAPAI